MPQSGICLCKLPGSSASDVKKCRRDSAAQKKQVKNKSLV